MEYCDCLLITILVNNKDIFDTDGISKATVEVYKRIVKTYNYGG